MSAHQETTAGNISAGGNVTIAPVQIVADPAQREWAEALLRGAVVALRLEPALQDAERCAERGDHRGAGEGFEVVAERLDRAGHHAAADEYRQRAALMLEQAGESSLAFEALVRLMQGHVDRGEECSERVLEHLHRLADENTTPLSTALRVASMWPEVSRQDLQALIDVQVHVRGRPDEAWWAATAAEQLSMIGDVAATASVANEATERLPLDGGVRLRLELDRLDALEKGVGVAVAENAWSVLLDWADDLADRDPSDLALVHGRRAVTLAYRGDLEGCQRQALRAVTAWSRVPGHQDQAAEAFFTHRTARHLLGAPPQNDSEPSGLAARLRGEADTLAARAERHELAGLHDRLADRKPQALRHLLLSLRDSQRAGNLRGTMAACRAVAELHEHAGLLQLALSMRITCGDRKAAGALAGQLTAEDVVAVLALDGPRWERAASLAALAARSSMLDPAVVTALAPGVLDEAEGDPETPWNNDPVLLARRAALAWVLAEDTAVRDRALRLARRLSGEGGHNQRAAAVRALLNTTETKISDESSLLLADFTAEQGTQALPFQALGDLARRDHTVAHELREAARGGFAPALRALAYARLVADDPDLQVVAIARTESALEATTHRETERERQVSCASFVGVGYVGRTCPEPLRVALSEKLVALAADPEDTEANRASALAALRELAPGLPPGARDSAFESLLELARGGYAPSEWDREHSASLHPYSRWRMAMPAGVLRGAALRACAVLAEGRPGLVTQLGEVVRNTAVTDAPLLTASLEAAALHPELELPVPIKVALGHPDADVRAAAFKVHLARAGLPTDDVLSALLQDPVLKVRLMLHAAARDRGDRELLERLAADPHALVRALARRDLV